VIDVRKGEQFVTLLNTGTDRLSFLCQSVPISKGFYFLQVIMHSHSLYADGTSKVFREVSFLLVKFSC
jgi:hypothetical protein